MKVPRLHLVTDDAVLARDDFVSLAADLLAAGGPALALHIRGHASTGRALYGLSQALRGISERAGSKLLLNDRVDVALAAAADGVQLGRRSVPVARARALVARTWIGYSAHAVAEAKEAVEAGADFIVLGTVYDSPTHRDARGAGTGLLQDVATAIAAPVIAIGGITAGCLPELARSGASGAAVSSAVWSAHRPLVELEALVEGTKVFEP